MNEPPQKPIFYDETRRRGNLTFFLVVSGTILCVIGAIVLLFTIITNPQLPAINLRPSVADWQNDPQKSVLGKAYHKAPTIVRATTRGRARNLFVLHRNAAVQEAKQKLADAIVASKRAPVPKDPLAPVRLGFYVNWDKPSLDSLKLHAGDLTHVAAAWLRLRQDGSDIVSDQSLTPANPDPTADVTGQTNDDVAIQVARRHGVAILPMIQNADSADFQPSYLHAMLSKPKNRATVINSLLNFVQAGHYQGINVDFETDSPDDTNTLTAFMSEIYAVFHPRGLLVTEDIEVDSPTYQLSKLAKTSDFLIPMLYDEHSSGTAPGPVASQTWFTGELSKFMQAVPANKCVVGLANYGYDWQVGKTDANEVSFESATRIAQESRDGNDGRITIDRNSLNPYFTYNEGDLGNGAKHIVWTMDATTLFNQITATQKYPLRGIALWRLGTEDPTVWTFAGESSANTLSTFDPNRLTQIVYNGFGTQFEGEGDILDVVAAPSNGLRTITIDPVTKQITNEEFMTYPSRYVIQRRGLVNQITGLNDQKKIAFTFDDGPDPRWTPRILDILEQYHVPGTFFVVGINAEAHPDLIQREWNDGMEIGNHSYTHPEMDSISSLQIKLELDATQRVIEALTGHKTTLFRAPNHADSEPETLADFAPILDADKMGYLFVGNQIDPTDWKPGITAQSIIKTVLANADQGNCILMHDAGGDTREQTILALPVVIQDLKKRGYTFVSVSDLVGKPRSAVFPAVTGKDRLEVLFDRSVFDVMYWVAVSFTLLFVCAIVLGILRIVLMSVLAVRQSRNENLRTFDPTYSPTVSVVIAAFNEAKVINNTIATLLRNNYPDIEIVVVDDGSTDNTSAVVNEAYGSDPRVSVLTKENGGKASALNLGIRQCQGEIIVALDADTVFAPETVSRLVRHFSDPNIGAVSGNVKVGNRKNPLTIWQAVEYITSQNFDRRAFDLLNCITVVPGAVGAWRKDAIALAGMYSSQTLAEDTDLTFKVRKLGYRIVTDNSALAYTEAPDTLRDLAKQRFRWAFGTLQCLWKHRAALFNPRYGTFGTIAMPSLWVYQIGFQALAPIVDLTVAWAFLYGFVIAPNTLHNGATMLLGYWAVFSSIELAGAWLAFRLDNEDTSLLGWLLLQRFVYRQLMYYVIVKSIWAAMRGSLVGWGKFERKGTVQQPVRIGQPPRSLNSISVTPINPDELNTMESESQEDEHSSEKSAGNS